MAEYVKVGVTPSSPFIFINFLRPRIGLKCWNWSGLERKASQGWDEFCNLPSTWLQWINLKIVFDVGCFETCVTFSPGEQEYPHSDIFQPTITWCPRTASALTGWLIVSRCNSSSLELCEPRSTLSPPSGLMTPWCCASNLSQELAATSWECRHLVL